jgi:crossover junction endodeoxyribonuclease RuvC
VRVIGIDPGTYQTGFGIIDDDNGHLSYVASGCLESRAQQVSKRYESIYSQLVAVLEEYKPQMCAVESAFYYKNPQVTMRLGEIRGIVILSAIQWKMDIVEYSPLEVKKSVVGYGRADKTQVRKMVKALLGLKTISGANDVSDALAIAICHIHNRKSITRYLIKTI